MNWISNAVVVALVFGILFSLISMAPFATSSRQRHLGMAPNKPLISQLDALEVAFEEAKRHDPDTNDIAIWFSAYNASKLRDNKDVMFEQIYGGSYNWSLVHHIRHNPEGLKLALYYFHPNGTQYSVEAEDYSILHQAEVTSSYCNPSIDRANTSCNFAVYELLSDRFVYGLDVVLLPDGIPNYFLVDAETGEVVKSSLNFAVRPLGVNIYENIEDAKNIGQLNEEKLHPPLSTELKIKAGSHMEKHIPNFAPSESRASITINNKVVWTNEDSVVHTVRSDNKEYRDPLTQLPFASGEIKPGGTYEFTFTELGEFPYHCDIHPWMKAKIVIVENFA